MNDRILIAFTLCLACCSTEHIGLADNTVHLAGYVANSNMDGDGVASYWRDNIYTSLTGGDILSRVSSLCVDGSSVLIGGSRRVVNTMPTAVVWKDNTETEIEGSLGGAMVASRNDNLFGVWLGTTGWVYKKNGSSQPIIDTAYNFAPMAMTVLGDDVYASGYSSGRPLPPNYSPPQHAQYWKNGQLIFRERESSNALSIFVHQNDIYMAGLLYPPGGDYGFACYWKNGQRVDLTDGSETAMAKSVFVTDTHVYVAGMLGDQAVYWIDGKPIVLTAGTNAMANSIFVHENDVHVAGYENGHPAYWKNDSKQNIVNQDKLGQLLFVVVGSN